MSLCMHLKGLSHNIFFDLYCKVHIAHVPDLDKPHFFIIRIIVVNTRIGHGNHFSVMRNGHGNQMSGTIITRMMKKRLNLRMKTGFVKSDTMCILILSIFYTI